MLELRNHELRIELLDPVADRRHLGPRFCGGGFIWQVHDLVAGPLLSGPEFPAADPDPFNGQGLPESFRHRTRDGRPLTWRGDVGVALGAGELALDATGQPFLRQPCVWEISAKTRQIEFITRHRAASFDYELHRRVAVDGRTVISHTRLFNRSPDRLSLQWFAHPFFALADQAVRGELPAGTQIAENPGFVLEGNALTQKRIFQHLKDGHMEPVQLPPQPLVATFEQTRIEHVTISLNVAPSSCVIWGNDRTFSIEPYLDLDLTPGAAREWELRYDFGPRR